MARHGGVQRREAILLEQIMEGGDVTESDEPFGMLPELGKIQFAYQMHGSVTAPATEYDFGFFIVHSFLQVFEALPLELPACFANTTSSPQDFKRL